MQFYNRRYLRIFLQYSAFALILFGIKLWVIQSFGNATPYWDQWDAEAANLYEPFLNGTLSWIDLFATHNVHRIFTTRILALILLNVNGIWNPLLQMIVNAVLHIATITVLILLLTRVIGKKYTSVLLFISVLLFSLPYDWENTLAGFQAQFYFVILFSIISLWFTSTEHPFSLRWWLGVSGAVLAFFSFASGVFALASAAFMVGIFYLLGLRKTNKQIIAILVLAGGFGLGIALTPLATAGAEVTLSSHDFLKAMVNILRWPLPSNFLSALFCSFPALFFVVFMFRKRPHINDRRWFLMSLVIWMLGQDLSIAFGRGGEGGGITPRYLSLFALSLLINFVCFIAVARFFVDKRKEWIVKSAGAWLFIIFLSLGLYVIKHIPGQIIEKRDTGILQEINTSGYLLSDDFTYLENKPFLHIPYPSAKRLAFILESDKVRAILPSNIREPISYISVKNNLDNAFVFNQCCSPSTPKPKYMTLGSYAEQGDLTTGSIIIEFDFNHSRSPWVAIPVAGYPLAKDITLEIEQNEKRTPIKIKSNPREAWEKIYIKVDKGIFFIHLSDLSSKTWVAVGMPVEVGRLDTFVSALLVNYHIFLIIGLVIGVFAVMPDSTLERKSTASSLTKES